MYTTVCEFMRPCLATVSQHGTVSQAVRALCQADAREVFVVNDAGELRGCVSEAVLLRCYLRGDSGLEAVTSLMTCDVPCIAPTATLDEAARRFQVEWCQTLAVTEDTQLLGILLRTDLLFRWLRPALPDPKPCRLPRPNFLDAKTTTTRDNPPLISEIG